MTAALQTFPASLPQIPSPERSAARLRRYRPSPRRRSSPEQDWTGIQQALVRGDADALARVGSVIRGVLLRSRTFDLQPIWEEIAQDALSSLVRSAGKGALRETRAFVAYCATVTRNELARRLTQLQRARQRQSSTEVDVLPDFERRTDDLDLRLDLDRALASLPRRQRIVVEALYLEGRSYSEAARHLNLPLGTLKRLQTSALRSLRETMEAQA